MSFFGKNIKKIRSVKGLSQSAFADIFDITRASIGAYEEGRAEPKVDTIIQIADYFKITLEKLLKYELTVNDIQHFDQEKFLFANETQRDENTILRIDLQQIAESKKSISVDFINQITKNNSLNEIFSCQIVFTYFGKNTESLVNGDSILCRKIKSENNNLKKNLLIITYHNYYIGYCFDIKENIYILENIETNELLQIDISDILVIFEISGIYKNGSEKIGTNRKLNDIEKKLNEIGALINSKIS